MNIAAKDVRNLLGKVAEIGREDARRVGELLERITPIYAQKRKLQEKRLKDGELFNIFDILQRRTDEVKGHSAFLATLLDPNAPHGQGDKFLAAFCNQTGVKFDCNDASVEKEKWFDDGRMDIVITQKDKKKVIVIENKIYAGDQPS